MPNGANGDQGWVDTHVHLLPGLDDGPATMEEAVAMAEAAIADGTSHAITTPHANYQFRFVRDAAVRLSVELQERIGNQMRIMVGCELHLSFENVQAALATPRDYSLNASRYLLVEFPEFFERTALRGALERFLAHDITPVLAHPERNPVLQQHPDTLGEYLGLGCLSQITASSLTGRFGKRARLAAADLLRRRWVHLVASDGHSAQQRPPVISAAFDLLASMVGGETAMALCSGNPRAVAQDQELPLWPTPEVKKKSFFARLRS